MKLSKTQQRLLQALAGGFTLKSQRYLDGAKLYQLYPLAGPPEPVSPADVDRLTRAGLIYSNQKFPAATYGLTELGRAVTLAWNEKKDSIATIP